MFNIDKIITLTVDDIFIINGLQSVAKEAKENGYLQKKDSANCCKEIAEKAQIAELFKSFVNRTRTSLTNK